jgi:hypothetical protein
VNQLAKNVQQKEEALLKKKEEIEKPGAPLDGAALGQALLRDLGFFGEAAAPKKDGAATPKAPEGQVDIMEHSLVRRAIRKMPKPSS